MIRTSFKSLSAMTWIPAIKPLGLLVHRRAQFPAENGSAEMSKILSTASRRKASTRNSVTQKTAFSIKNRLTSSLSGPSTIDGCTPRSAGSGPVKKGPKSLKIISFPVRDGCKPTFQNHRQATLMAGINQPFEPLRTSIRILHRGTGKRRHIPSCDPRELSHRHEHNCGYAQILSSSRCGTMASKGAWSRKSPYMEFVNHIMGQRYSRTSEALPKQNGRQ